MQECPSLLPLIPVWAPSSGQGSGGKRAGMNQPAGWTFTQGLTPCLLESCPAERNTDRSADHITLECLTPVNTISIITLTKLPKPEKIKLRNYHLGNLTDKTYWRSAASLKGFYSFAEGKWVKVRVAIEAEFSREAFTYAWWSEAGQQTTERWKRRNDSHRSTGK